jgi:hypothetical protein
MRLITFLVLATAFCTGLYTYVAEGFTGLFWWVAFWVIFKMAFVADRREDTDADSAAPAPRNWNTPTPH